MVVRIQSGSVLLRDGAVATSSGCCCGKCPPGQVQCGPDCCTQEQTCCSGECCDTVCCNGVCCQPGELCIDGECVGQCLCPDFCIYQTQWLTPLPAPQFPALPCGQSDSFQLTTAPYAVANCLPHPFTQISEGYRNASSSFAQTGFFDQRLQGQYLQTFRASAYTGPPVVEFLAQLQHTLSLNYDIFCEDFGADDTPRLFVRLTLSAVTGANGTPASGCVFGEIAVLKSGTYPLPVGECEQHDYRSCLTLDPAYNAARKIYLLAPIGITAGINGTSLGPWQSEETTTEGDTSCVQSCFNEAAGAFSASFRISQRPSCRIVACNCGTDLDGLKATFQGVELTLGTSYDQTFPEDGYDRRITHGSSFGVYYFTQYEILPGNLFRDELNIELFCDTDEDADPPVSRWYARFISKCRVIDEFTNITAETTRTEIGYFVCGESAGCGGRASGDPIPLGEATEIEEEPGSPVTTDGLDACEPPTRASLSLSEDCG